MSTISGSDARPGFIPTTNSGSQGRPLKKRHACTQCHAIKIRCTGEKTGCARCQNLRLNCEYTVSMVGRMSTKRNHRWNSTKRNSANISSATSQASSEPSDTTSIPMLATPTNSNPSLGSDFNICSNSGDFGTEYFSEFFDATVLPAPVGPKDPLMAVSMPDDSLGMLANTQESESNFPSMGAQDQASLDDTLPMLSSAGEISSQAPNNTSLGALSLAPTKTSPLSLEFLGPSLQSINNNSEFLFKIPYLLPIVNTIAIAEAHLQSAYIPIDEAMCTNKACMNQISRSMENEDFIKCNSCSLLIATAMQMVIMLYEKALSASDNVNSSSAKDDSSSCTRRALTSSPHSAMSNTLINNINTTTTSSSSNDDQQYAVSSSSARSSSSNMPNLLFGVFQFEPEEPIWFRNQIIRKELKRCIETLRACHTEEHQNKVQGATGRSSPVHLIGDKVRKTWLVEMERRANSLMASLPVGRVSDADPDVEKDRACQRGRGRKRSIENVLVS